MANNFDIVMALKDGKPVHVKDVERGLKCGCKCAACGEDLVARQGKVRAWHFAHKSGKNCAYGFESSLHLTAKNLIGNFRCIDVPDVRMEFPTSDKQAVTVMAPHVIFIESVEIERRTGGVVPDVVVKTCDGQEVFIEIAVTHFVDDAKLEKLRAIGVPTLEIALKGDYDQADLEYMLKTGDTSAMRWVYHPEADVKYQNLLNSSDKMPVTRNKYVMNCPLKKRQHGGIPFALANIDCYHCEYCVATDRTPSSFSTVWCEWKAVENRILSSQRETKFFDLDIAHDRSDEKAKAFRRDVLEGKCPICCEKLSKKVLPVGHVYACKHCNFYTTFEEAAELKCLKCRATLAIRNGRKGYFVGCSAYPYCTFTIKVF